MILEFLYSTAKYGVSLREVARNSAYARNRGLICFPLKLSKHKFVSVFNYYEFSLKSINRLNLNSKREKAG